MCVHMVYISTGLQYSPPKVNMEPENRFRFEKEHHLPNINFLGSMLVFKCNWAAFNSRKGCRLAGVVFPASVGWFIPCHGGMISSLHDPSSQGC